MPFLKFSRDKRGYENYYLFDGKGRARLLFWFRTPPDVKVGRVSAFPDDIRKLVEAQNPGVFFDWARIMATPIPSPDVDKWRERRRVEKAAKRAAREADAEEAEAAAAEAAEAAAAAPVVDAAAVEELANAEAEGDAEGDDAVLDVGPEVGAVEAETPAAASDVQNAQPGQPDQQGPLGQQGHRRRRRRRRGRRGGGPPQPAGAAGVSATDVTSVTDSAQPEPLPSSEPETSSNDEV